MARARIEYVRLGGGGDFDGVAQNIIRSFHGAVEIEVSTTATDEEDRPVVPAFGPARDGYAIIRGLEGAFIVAWGDDPTAALLGGKMVAADEEAVILVAEGQLLSFIEVA